MRRLWEDLHLSAGAFSAVYALQLAGTVPSLVAAGWGALFVGRGGPEVQSTGSIARCFHGPSLVERCGRLSKRRFFSPPDDGAGGSEAGVYGFASGRSGVLILADSGSGTPPAVASVRKIPSPTILAWKRRKISPTLGLGGEKTLWARTSKHSKHGYRCSIICSSTAGSVGLQVTGSMSDSVRCMRKPGRRSMSTRAKTSSTATGVARAAICFASSS